MGHLTTHVLDLVAGCPAREMTVKLFRLDSDGTIELATAATNSDGRVAEPLISGSGFSQGLYQVEFHVGAYFSRTAGKASPISFLDVVPIRFGVSDPDANYHVPLLVTPWSYSTYRGS
jgi:5-hydroxyisourate hydrolase